MLKKLSVIMTFVLLFTSTACQNAESAPETVNAEVENIKTQYLTEYEKYFEKDKVIDVKIKIDETDYNDMLENALDEQYKSADITIDSTTVENAGIRTKGNMTLRSVAQSDSDRYSFRIKFDKYVDGQTLDGLDELVLNNMYSDSSYMREYLSYEALREIGIDVPKCVFANIYINDELKGLYLCVEAIDDSYIERAFKNTSGNLYKGDNNSNLVYKENNSYDTLELKMGSDTDKKGLKNLIKVLNSIENGDSKNIEEILDVDTALKYIAFNYVFSNYDSYCGNNGNNYYLYEDNGVFKVIPWDFNMSFGGFMKGGNTDINMPVAGNANSYPLVSKLLSVDEYKEKYYAYVRELTDYMAALEERINELKTVISEYVEADPTKFCTMEDFEKSTTYSEDELENIPPMDSSFEDGNMPNPPDNFDDNKMSAFPGNPPDNNRMNRPFSDDFKYNKNNPKNAFGNRGNMMNNTSSLVNFAKTQTEKINLLLSDTAQ